MKIYESQRKVAGKLIEILQLVPDKTRIGNSDSESVKVVLSRGKEIEELVIRVFQG